MSSQDKKLWTFLILVTLVFIALLFYDYNQYQLEQTRPDPVLRHQEPKITTLAAVGDILLSRHVGTKIDQANNPNLPFEKIQDILSSADITFGNLECPLSDSGVPIREGLVFRCLIEYVPGLKNAGFDVLSTANNHSFDQGENNLLFILNRKTSSLSALEIIKQDKY